MDEFLASPPDGLTVPPDDDSRATPASYDLAHPSWIATRMGTLDGAIEVEPCVRGVADVVKRHRGSGLNLYRDWEDRPLEW